MRNFTHRWPQSGHFFPKLGLFFPIFEKGQGRPRPPYPSQDFISNIFELHEPKEEENERYNITSQI